MRCLHILIPLVVLAMPACQSDATIKPSDSTLSPPPIRLEDYEVMVSYRRQDPLITTSRFGIATISSDGARENILYSDTAAIDSPAISPNGTQLAFERWFPADGTAQLYVYDRDRKAGRTISPQGGDARTPDWSPDGQSIVYSLSTNNQVHQIVISAPDGSGLRALTSSLRPKLGARWSPEGRSIAFAAASEPGGLDFSIWIMNADGTNETQLTTITGPSNDSLVAQVSQSPSWSPDGKSLAYARGVPGKFPEVHVMRANGAESERVAVIQLLTQNAPAWRPDGRALVADLRIVPPSGSLLLVTTLTGAVSPFIAATSSLRGSSFYLSPRWIPIVKGSGRP
jgi:Tol biopolymer transport system component